MDCNDRHVIFLSRETSEKFQIQGKLRVGRRQQEALTDKFCRVRGNFLFIQKKKGGELEEVLLLERCKIVSHPENNRKLKLDFESQDPPLFLKFKTSAECVSWLTVLRDANTEALRHRIAYLQKLLNKHTSIHTLEHTHTAVSCSRESDDANVTDGAIRFTENSCVRLKLEYVGVASADAQVELQVCVTDANTNTVGKHSCAVEVETAGGHAFLTTLCCHGDYSLNYHSRIEVSIYHKD